MQYEEWDRLRPIGLTLTMMQTLAQLGNDRTGGRAFI